MAFTAAWDLWLGCTRRYPAITLPALEVRNEASLLGADKRHRDENARRTQLRHRLLGRACKRRPRQGSLPPIQRVAEMPAEQVCLRCQAVLWLSDGSLKHLQHVLLGKAQRRWEGATCERSCRNW